jgi:4-hydroxyphenylacetate 3-monooxygenase
LPASLGRCWPGAAGGGQNFADNVVKFYEHLRDNHLYASYAIVPPQIDRSKPAHRQSDPTLYAGVVKERDDGIVISGAQQLATAGVFSDYLHLACIHPLQPGDENYANALAVRINTPGLKLYPRRAFATAAMNSFDYPLSSRFDETDCFCVFDKVFVPWEYVFIYRNLAISREPVVEDTGSSLRQLPSAVPLCDQAAIHDGTGQTHE